MKHIWNYFTLNMRSIIRLTISGRSWLLTPMDLIHGIEWLLKDRCQIMRRTRRLELALTHEQEARALERTHEPLYHTARVEKLKEKLQLKSIEHARLEISYKTLQRACGQLTKFAELEYMQGYVNGQEAK